MKMAWVCDKCNWLQVSDSKERHTMDMCRCDKSAVDLEEGYSRSSGNPRTIAVLEDGKEWEVKLRRRKKK